MEPWQTFVIQSGALGALVIFMRAQVRQQGRLFDWFTAKMNGTLDALREATENNTDAVRELKAEVGKTTPAVKDLKDEIGKRESL